MKVLMISVKDCAAGTYSFPMSFANELVLKREVKSLVNSLDSQSPIARFPEDHQVYKVGEYDLLTGKGTFCEPELLFNCNDCIERGIENG